MTLCQYRRMSTRRSAQSAALITRRPSWNCNGDLYRPKSLANSDGGVKQGAICLHAESGSAARLCPTGAKPAHRIGKTTTRVDLFISRIIGPSVNQHFESTVQRIFGEIGCAGTDSIVRRYQRAFVSLRVVGVKDFSPILRVRAGCVQEWGGASSPRLVSTEFYGDEPSPPLLAHFLPLSQTTDLLERTLGFRPSTGNSLRERYCPAIPRA